LSVNEYAGRVFWSLVLLVTGYLNSVGSDGVRLLVGLVFVAFALIPDVLSLFTLSLLRRILLPLMAIVGLATWLTIDRVDMSSLGFVLLGALAMRAVLSVAIEEASQDSSVAGESKEAPGGNGAT